MLTKEIKILIKNVWKSKKYGVTQLIKEFSNKKWRTWCGGLSEAIAINGVH